MSDAATTFHSGSSVFFGMFSLEGSRGAITTDSTPAASAHMPAQMKLSSICSISEEPTNVPMPWPITPPAPIAADTVARDVGAT